MRLRSPVTQQVTTLVSSGVNYNSGVAVDGSGNVYFADSVNNTINELPRAFPHTADKTEPSTAGTDVVSVLPAMQDLTGVYAPQSSDPSWLIARPAPGGHG